MPSYHPHRRDLVDRDQRRNGTDKTARIDLGLALLQRRCKPGEPLTHDDIAAWAGCSPALIHHIQRTALRKIRAIHDSDLILAELLQEQRLNARRPARRTITAVP